MKKEKQQKKSPIVFVVICIGVFFGAFQLYMFLEKESYIYATDFLEDTAAVIEVSMEDEEETYYVSHQQNIFDQLLQGLDSATFKPTKQTPKNLQYTIRIYNESLQVETTLSVYPNNQMEINDEFYNVDEGNVKSFEEAMFTKENEVILHTYNEFSTIVSNKLFHVGWVSEEKHDWAEVIALVRIAKDKEIDLTGMNLLSVAPTKEVAERLIAYEMIEPYDYTSLMEAVQLERLGVAEVLLEREIGISPDNTLIGNPSPMVVAKLNEDREIVDLLLSYGFEDEYVDPKHIERAQNVIRFKGEDSAEVIAGLKKGKLPGVDFQIPTSSKEIIETWGEHTVNEDSSNLKVNRHRFYRMIDVHSENENQDYDDVFAYMYEFHNDQLPQIGDIQELLGDPDDMYINQGIREIEYAYGEYSLNFIIDDHGNVRNVYYYHEF